MYTRAAGGVLITDAGLLESEYLPCRLVPNGFIDYWRITCSTLVIKLLAKNMKTHFTVSAMDE